MSDELIHFGTKGMKWGVRKKIDEVKRQRSMNKEERKRQRQEYNDSIDAARVRVVKSGAAYNAALVKYKTEKKTIGKVAAKRKVDIARQKFADDAEVAEMVKNGRERVTHALGIAGGAVLSGLAGAAIGTIPSRRL